MREIWCNIYTNDGTHQLTACVPMCTPNKRTVLFVCVSGKSWTDHEKRVSTHHVNGYYVKKRAWTKEKREREEEANSAAHIGEQYSIEWAIARVCSVIGRYWLKRKKHRTIFFYLFSSIHLRYHLLARNWVHCEGQIKFHFSRSHAHAHTQTYKSPDCILII